MITDDHTLTASAPAVIPTKPAKIPLRAIVKSGFLMMSQLAIIDAIPPAHAANVVVVNTNPNGPGLADRTEPPLNPNHPKNRRKVPIAARGRL